FQRLWSDRGVYAFSRSFEGKTVVAAMNVSESPQQIQVTYEAKKKPKPIFGETAEISTSDGQLLFTIPPRSGVLLK
ncbi:MAG TPA: alpha-glucosidase C-terminal domain-containing protein, partial [Anaerolineales bacterium]|nr:alpha-glucosidase C-terminal domain-containing protein [Anaerolineales bacterium]